MKEYSLHTSGGIRIRPFRLASDVQPMLQLLEAIEEIDQLEQEISESALRAEFEWHGHEPELDRWIVESAEDKDAFLGYAWTFSQTNFRSVLHVAVHPHFRRQGVGSALLVEALERARAVGATQVVTLAESDNIAANAFLKRHGYIAAGHNRFMSAPAAVPLPLAVWPPGFKVRSLTEFRDISYFVEAANACYSTMWGHTQNTVQSTVEGYLKSVEEYPDYFNPDGMLVVFDARDNVSGICSGYVETDSESGRSIKIIDSPAIVPTYQSLNLLRPLVLTTMHWLNSLAGGDFRLETWGDSETAVAVYQDIGFTLLPHGFETEYLLEEF